MVEIRKQVGRPEKTDSDGNRIVTKVINVNAPVKFIEFLKDNGINRSELFTKVAASFYKKEICNVCYSKLHKSPVGNSCDNCSHQYYLKPGEIKTVWKLFNSCAECQTPYSHENLYAQTKQGLHGCQECQEPKQERLDINEFKPEEKNDAL